MKVHRYMNCYTLDLSVDLMDPVGGPSNLPFGLPVPLAEKLLVSLTGDKVLQVHSYLLEFCEGQAVLASVPGALAWTLSEMVGNRNNVQKMKCLLVVLL